MPIRVLIGKLGSVTLAPAAVTAHVASLDDLDVAADGGLIRVSVGTRPLRRDRGRPGSP
jgi:hypothetical protein